MLTLAVQAAPVVPVGGIAVYVTVPVTGVPPTVNATVPPSAVPHGASPLLVVPTAAVKITVAGGDVIVPRLLATAVEEVACVSVTESVLLVLLLKFPSPEYVATMPYDPAFRLIGTSSATPLLFSFATFVAKFTGPFGKSFCGFPFVQGETTGLQEVSVIVPVGQGAAVVGVVFGGAKPQLWPFAAVTAMLKI